MNEKSRKSLAHSFLSQFHNFYPVVGLVALSTKMDASSDHDPVNLEQEAPARKKRRVSTKATEEKHQDSEQHTHGANSPTINAAISSNRHAFADWSSSEARNEQKLQATMTGAARVNAPKPFEDGNNAAGISEEKTEQEPLSGNKRRRDMNARRLSSGVPTTIRVYSPVPRTKRFPEKLQQVLANQDLLGSIAWHPDGNSFVVVSKDRLVKEVLPRYFKEAKFASFTRKLNRWGFRRISSELHGPDAIVYHHRLFKRDYPELCKGMSGGNKPEEDFSYLCDPTIHGTRVGSQTTMHGLPASTMPMGLLAMGGRPQVLPSSTPLSQQLQSGLTPLEARLLQQQTMSSALTGHASHIGDITARTLHLRALSAELELRNRSMAAELELRNRALSIIQSPLGASAAGSTTALGRYYGVGMPQRRISDGLDAALLVRCQEERNGMFFRTINQQASLNSRGLGQFPRET